MVKLLKGLGAAGKATASYTGLARVKDEPTKATIKILMDRVSSLEAALAATTAALQAVPSTEGLATQQFVLQQVAALRTTPGSPTYPVGPGVPGDPNTIPEGALPLPAHGATVAATFAANPGFVATSCQSAAGGTWDLMDAIVDDLRALDTRWGYNGKRGNINDPSNDALAYDFGAVAGGEGTTDVYIVDVIAGHCGPNPQPAFNDVTVFAPGVWTGRGRF